MGLMDILQRYANAKGVSNPNRAQDDFDEISGAAPLLRVDRIGFKGAVTGTPYLRRLT
jgi:hypothetical protein